MAELAKNITLSNNYQKLATLIGGGFSFDTSKTYFIQNLGNSTVYLIESSTTPTDESARGFMIQTGDCIEYKPTASYDIYGLGGLSLITISERA